MRVLLAGLCTVDVVQRVDELPEPGHKVQSRSAETAAGGPATNAAVTVAALGGRPTLLTVLGAHPLAELARTDLAACGVDVLDALPTHPDPPAVSAVAVRERDGERTVVSHNAAALPEKLAAVPLPTTSSTDAVLVDGHHPALALAAARWAREEGVPVVVDAGSWKPVFADVFPLADVVACSADFRAPDGALADVPTVITTAGPDPVRWRSGGESGEVAVPSVEAKDTLGAGDVWHGALVARAGELPIPELIGFANEVAAERVRHSGPRSWLGPVRARMGER
ncbi:ribokinase [Prauserella coralliicola]|nr:ribokinase [Prauserella coralliicola]